MKLEFFNWKCNLDADCTLIIDVSVKTAASLWMAGVMKIAGRSSRFFFFHLHAEHIRSP